MAPTPSSTPPEESGTSSPGSAEDVRRGRGELFADASLTGRSFVGRYTALVDGWLAALFDVAAGPDREGCALVAVGGYGRGELCPGSDLDVLFLHRDEVVADAVAERIWYPVWDAGFHLGHSVRTPSEALSLARDDLDTATAMLDLRHLAGDVDLSRSIARSARVHWQRGSAAWLKRLEASVRSRHADKGEVAFLLEPDLKGGRGGLRDVHAVHWARQLGVAPLAVDDDALAAAHDVLLAVRVELHRRNQGRGDVLLLQEQDAIAAALGDADADVLLGRVAGAARAVAWNLDLAWEQLDRGAGSLGRGGRFARRARRVVPEEPRPLTEDAAVVGGRVRLTAGASLVARPELLLEVAAAAAEEGLRLDRDTLLAFAAHRPSLPEPWPAAAREAFVRLLRTGRSAVAVLEDLDQSDLWTAVLPEWALVRNRPQRNAYHRFTVDRHLVETAAEAAQLAANVDRPDLLVLGALLHDLGKGGGGDHRATGATLAQSIMTRLGYAPADVALVAKLVRHHLLLPEVATRRDLTDPATVAAVVAAVEDVEALHLLAALAEADGRATGPAAWSNWKAGLIGELVRLVEAALGGADAPTARDELPNEEELELLAARRPAVRAGGTTLTVVARDRPGLFSRVAGVLALHGLQVVWAGAHSDDRGWALERFQVANEGRDAARSVQPEDRWDDVRRDLARVLDGRLALHARLAERARAYRPSTRQPRQIASRVVVDNEASTRATVLEVHAADSVGLLYRITAALSDLDLDLRSARVETLGDEVVDVFYVRDVAGGKVVDPAYLDEIERALLFAIEFG